MLTSGAYATPFVLGEAYFLQGTESKIFSSDVLEAAGSDSGLSLFHLLNLGLSRLDFSDEPIPPAAVLILVGLVALIALKGRRK